MPIKWATGVDIETKPPPLGPGTPPGEVTLPSPGGPPHCAQTAVPDEDDDDAPLAPAMPMSRSQPKSFGPSGSSAASPSGGVAV
eukprot:11838801-Prorocentrum_lima.AAC.1